MINDKYQQGRKTQRNRFVISSNSCFFLCRMYQLEKDEGSEFGAAIVHTGPSASKMSLTPQKLVKEFLYLI